MYLLNEEAPRNVVALKVVGRLTAEDHRSLVPELEQALAGMEKVALLIELEDFQGWDLDSAWTELKFGLAHDRQIVRLAIVGEGGSERWTARIADWFLHAEVKCFDRENADDAWAWVEGR